MDGWLDGFSPSIEKAFDRVLWPFVAQLIFTSQVNQSMLSMSAHFPAFSVFPKI